MMRSKSKRWFGWCSLISWLTAASAFAGDPFVIETLDSQTGRGIPLVTLTTVNGIALHSDSAGVIAFDEPGLMDRSVYFFIESDGYALDADGFGYQGKALHTTPGRSTKLILRRINLAERLYRLTGQGIYHHSALAGRLADPKMDQLPAQVMGSDSVITAMYDDRLFWVWGDTHRTSYPLGNFHVAGATSPLAVDPNRSMDFDYFVNPDGFAKKLARMPGDGPTWLTALFTVRDKTGNEQLLASYAKVEPPLNIYARGLCVWQPDEERFVHRLDLDLNAPLLPLGHPCEVVESGERYMYFGDPFPTMRCKASLVAALDPSSYEAVECTVDLVDVIEGKSINAHRGSATYNPWRKKFVAIFTEEAGRSYLGEVWYAESTSLLGPWKKAIRIATHSRASFYNPRQHPYFAEEDGQIIYFEGTWTAEFSGSKQRIPRYDYNQLMYRLDLGGAWLSKWF